MYEFVGEGDRLSLRGGGKLEFSVEYKGTKMGECVGIIGSSQAKQYIQPFLHTCMHACVHVCARMWLRRTHVCVCAYVAQKT